MKLQGTFLAIAVAAFSMTAFAQQPPGLSPSAAIVKKQKVQIFTPSQPSKITKIERVEGMSSRPWTQIVGWHPGQSAFPSAETHESKLVVLWIGHEPWQ